MEKKQLLQQQYKKLWMILDNCIKTGKYVQSTGGYAKSESERCVMGVIYSEYGEPYAQTNGGFFTIHNVLNTNNIYGFKCYRDRQYIPTEGSKESMIACVKKQYKERGTIYTSFILNLNDRYGMTFEEFRDMFKEMDV